MEIYKSLDDAFEDIGFIKDGTNHKLTSLRFSEEREYVQPNVDSLFLWTGARIEEKGIEKYSELIHNSLYLFGEIIKNAYEHGIEPHSNQRILAVSYIGSKGALFGTKQYRNFLNKEQTNLLLAGQVVSSTSNNPDSGNWGTFDLFDNESGADGLLIREKEMKLYFSKYFS